MSIIDYADWSYKCTQCRAGKYFGNAPLSCKTKATAHAFRYMHIVSVNVNGQLRETVKPDQIELGDDPPF